MQCGRSACWRMVIVILICLGVFWFYKTSGGHASSAPVSVSVGSTVGSAMTKTEVDATVKEFILQNPEVIIESIELMQKRKVKDMEDRLQNAIKDKRAEIESTIDSPYAGNEDADVIVAVFYDYNCNYCKKANDIINQLLASDSNVKVLYKPLPVLGEASEYLSKLMLAVYSIVPDKFKAVHEGMMELRSAAKEDIKAVISVHGLNLEDLEIEMSSPKVNAMYNKILALASELRIHGAPAFIINGNFHAGLLELNNMQKIAEALRKTKAEESAPVTKDPVLVPAPAAEE
jgi:protein-disulfide isomerase